MTKDRFEQEQNDVPANLYLKSLEWMSSREKNYCSNDCSESSQLSCDNHMSEHDSSSPKIKSGKSRPSWLFSNHMVVNAERENAQWGLQPLQRSVELDMLAEQQAIYLAKIQRLEPLNRLRLCAKLGSKHVAENIVRGSDVFSMHLQCMEDLPGHRRHILSFRYNEMGMGTAKSADGYLYMVQYFRYNSETAELSIAQRD